MDPIVEGGVGVWLASLLGILRWATRRATIVRGERHASADAE